MQRQWPPNPAPIADGVTKLGLYLGLGQRHTYRLTTTGRKSGRRHTVAVKVTELDGIRYLVSPFGKTDWVRNAEASGTVILSRGRTSTRWAVRPVGPEWAAQVQRRYLQLTPWMRPAFDVAVDSDEIDFVNEAPRHPVFELSPILPGI